MLCAESSSLARGDVEAGALCGVGAEGRLCADCSAIGVWAWPATPGKNNNAVNIALRMLLISPETKICEQQKLHAE
jgi:hypothetical protein